METLLSVIGVWISVNFGLLAEGPHPEIEAHPSESISELWIESMALRRGADANALKGAIGGRSIVAFYDDQRRTVFLADRWDPTSPRDVSVLVHEMVHHLQNLDGRSYACAGERERVAYLAQDAWLGLFGTSLEDEFEIDAMTLLLSTRCMH